MPASDSSSPTSIVTFCCASASLRLQRPQQRHAALVAAEAVLELELSALQRGHDLVELGQRRAERELLGCGARSVQLIAPPIASDSVTAAPIGRRERAR